MEAYRRAGQRHILTNGILLNKHPEIYDKLLDCGIKEIGISSHFGVEKSLSSVPEKTVAKVIEEAKKKEFGVQIITLITPENYRKVRLMCNRSYELGADKIEFIRYVKSGSARTEGRAVLTEREKEEFFRSVVSIRESFDKKDLKILMHGNFGPRKESRGEKLAEYNRYCPAGKLFFVVDPQDMVYGCPLLMEFPIGKLVDGEVKIEKELCNGKRDKCLTDYLL